jgi:uncharacterized membrane protein
MPAGGARRQRVESVCDMAKAQRLAPVIRVPKDTKAAARAAIFRATASAAKCTGCANKARPNRTKCQACADRNKIDNKNRRLRLQAQGMCLTCLKRPGRPESPTVCAVCSPKATIRSHNRFERKRQSGYCLHGSPPEHPKPAKGQQLCDDCRAKTVLSPKEARQSARRNPALVKARHVRWHVGRGVKCDCVEVYAGIVDFSPKKKK